MSRSVRPINDDGSMRNIRGHHNALVIAAQWIPVAPAGMSLLVHTHTHDQTPPILAKHPTQRLTRPGALAAMLVPTVINRFKSHYIFLGSMIAFLIGAIMAAVAPVNGPYWTVTFPSMILVIAGPGTSRSSPHTLAYNGGIALMLIR